MIDDLLRFLKARRKNAPAYHRMIGRDGDFWLHDNFGDYTFHGERVFAGICWLLHYYTMIVHLLTLHQQPKLIILIQQFNASLRLMKKFQFI